MVVAALGTQLSRLLPRTRCQLEFTYASQIRTRQALHLFIFDANCTKSCVQSQSNLKIGLDWMVFVSRIKFVCSINCLVNDRRPDPRNMNLIKLLKKIMSVYFKIVFTQWSIQGGGTTQGLHSFGLLYCLFQF